MITNPSALLPKGLLPGMRPVLLAMVYVLASPILHAEDGGPAETRPDRGSPTWGTPPCEGVTRDNFQACPEALVGAATCCGVGVCASTGQYSCGGDQLQDSCVPGEPVSPTDDSCDGIDQDCSGESDEDFVEQATSCGTGACASSGAMTCQNGQISDSCEPGTPSPEACNGIDDDCDGTVDENNPEGGTTCSTGNVGVCSTGTTLCTNGSLSCEPDNEPSQEVCDGLDNDCDGMVDEGC